MALKRFSTSCPMGLIPELPELSLAAEEAAELEVDGEGLGVA